MLSTINKPFMLRVIMLNVVKLSVVALFLIAKAPNLIPKIRLVNKDLPVNKRSSLSFFSNCVKNKKFCNIWIWPEGYLKKGLNFNLRFLEKSHFNLFFPDISKFSYKS